MGMKWRLATLLISLAWHAQAAQMGDEILLKDGNALLMVCAAFVAIEDRGYKNISNDDLLRGMACTSYLRGFRGGLQLDAKNQSGWAHCAPDEAPAGQMVRVIVKWLQSNPQLLHLPSPVLIGLSMQKAFPCSGGT